MSTRNWHDLFRAWAKPPSDTEEAKGGRAARMAKAAIQDSAHLALRNVSATATGSYRNNTNTRLGSDVDIAMVCDATFFFDLPDGFTRADAGIIAASYSLDEYRRDLTNALTDAFGSDADPQDVTVTVAGNSGRLPCDVTPFFPYRKYISRNSFTGEWIIEHGVATERVSGGPRIVNWHEQHYQEGVSKNTATGRRFKRVARILKRLAADMSASDDNQASAAASRMSSFVLECLAFNAANSLFNQEDGGYYLDVRSVVLAMWGATQTDESAKNLTEVSGLKPVFGPHQKVTRDQANRFLLHAWHYVGFE